MGSNFLRRIRLGGRRQQRHGLCAPGPAHNAKAKAVILFPGNASGLLAEKIDKNEVIFDEVKDFAGAIKVLKGYGEDGVLLPGTTVLISPAAAHFYSRYVEGSGKDLKEWIKELITNN
jgi:hypothetical protein